MNTTKIAKVKSLLALAGSTMISVKFIKKNGEERKITLNPKTTKGVAGNNASEVAKKAIVTYNKNNPNIVRCYDSQLAAKGEEPNKCWRSFSAESVLEIKVKGKTYSF